MGKAFYRKYRSKNLAEIVGQEHITQTLDHALKQDSLSHAYLFTGPHGVGKTSIARILAHEANGFEYDSSKTHVDIIEIDAASNRRIDEMRDLRDKVAIAPVAGKYKIYIIDEVHMLTREAFNALLKTLEEPPAHVIFILATTEAHKLPDTIVSRTQRFVFKPLTIKQIQTHLATIAKTERIKIDEEALTLIAEYGAGSFRDSISLLEQVAQQSPRVTADSVRATLGVAPDELIRSLYAAAQNGPQQITAVIQQLQDEGFDPARVASQLSHTLRNSLLNNTQPDTTPAYLSALRSLLHIEQSADKLAAIELILIELYYAVPHAGEQTAMPPKKHDTPTQQKDTVVQKASASTTMPAPTRKQSVAKPNEPLVVSTAIKQEKTNTEFSWEDCLSQIKGRHNTLYGLLRIANASQVGNELHLTFQYAFHQKKISDARTKTIIADVVKQQCGRDLKVVTEVDKTHKSKHEVSASDSQISAPSKQDTTIDTISNIFGAAEVLE